MREILFRGKTDKDKEWVYGDLLHDGYDYDVAIWEQECKLVTEISPETVGRFTGLTDKNGKNIFEGDIHECIVGEESSLFVVKHGKYYDSEASDKKYGWYFENTKTNDCYSFYGDEKDYTNIIGNIHDNPELLGGASNE